MIKVKKYLKKLLFTFIAIIFIFSAIIFFVFRPYTNSAPNQIPRGWGFNKAISYKGNQAYPKKINVSTIAHNPNLANTNSSTMHVNSYASDAHLLGGPLGINPQIISYSHGAFAGECATVTFDSKGNIVAVFGTFKEFTLMLISPQTLKPLAKLSLPCRKSNKTLNLRKIMSDTSGGAYFFLDNNDQVILVDANQNLKIIEQVWSKGVACFNIIKEINLSEILFNNTSENDVITSILPDWEGRYWFVSRLGIIGVFNPITEDISVICLENEEIQNSFAIDKDGVYIVSDKALYGLTTNTNSDQPRIIWREKYERATKKKLGSITLGSGTTPTLLGNKFVAITDNADDRINVLVYNRRFDFTESRLICKVPVFETGKSATENTLIGVGNSLIVENNFGYDLFTNMMFGRVGSGGISRVDFCDETKKGKVIWYNPIISQTTVPKVSLENGLIYVYSKDPSVGWGIDAYYLTALDFDTGETIFEILTGTGVQYDNNWAPITLGPDKSAYIGVLRGLVKVYDQKK